MSSRLNTLGAEKNWINAVTVPLLEPEFTIGELAREYNISLRTLRFYEDKGLLRPKREGVLRIYSQSDRSRLELILKGKRLGFTLTEIREMIATHENQSSTMGQQLQLSREKCLEQLALLEQQQKDIAEAIAELHRTYEALTSIIEDA